MLKFEVNAGKNTQLAADKQSRFHNFIVEDGVNFYHTICCIIDLATTSILPLASV